MTIDLLICAVKELIKKKKQTFLTIMAIVISSIFITSFIGAGVGIKNFLFATIDESAITKQVILINDNNSIQFSDVEKLKNETSAKDVRVYLNYYITDIIFDNDLFNITSPKKVKIFDCNYSLLTNSELKSAELKFSVNYDKFNSGIEGIYVSEDILLKNKIDNNSDVIGKSIKIVFLNPLNNIKTTRSLLIKGVMPSDILSIIDQSQIADIFIPNKMISVEPRRIESITYDYEDYNNIRAIEKAIESKNFCVVSNNKEVIDIQTESIIYNIILALSGFIIVLATAFTMYNSLNISFKERVKYFGMLKSIGFNSFHIYCICIFQSLIMSVIGSIVGGIISNAFSGFLGVYLAKSILIDDRINIQANVFGIQWNLFFISIAVLLFSGVIAGIFPALKTSKKNPVDALSVEK